MDLGTTSARVRMLSSNIAEKCDLPPLPMVAARAMPLTRDPGATVQDLTRLVSGDAALAAQVLKISRSATYVGRGAPPGTLQDAIRAVGFETVRRIVVVASARSVYQANDPVAQTLWDHSLAAALAADELAKLERQPRGGPGFIAGLLHDVGKLVFHLSEPGLFVALGHFDEAQEKEIFGESHPAVGGMLAERWGLDDALVEAIMDHHVRPIQPGLAGLIAKADWIAHRIGYGSVPGEVEPLTDSLDLEPLVERVGEAFETERAFFG